MAPGIVLVVCITAIIITRMILKSKKQENQIEQTEKKNDEKVD